MVTVHFHTLLQRQSAQGRISRLEVALPADPSVRGLLGALAVKMAPDAIIFLVNGRTATVATPLADGDEVHLMPALSGGA